LEPRFAAAGLFDRGCKNPRCWAMHAYTSAMDLRLPLLADANLHLGIAEEAADEHAWLTTRNELDKAETALDELRALWPEMGQTEQGLLAAIAKPLRLRADQVASRLPTTVIVSDGSAEHDPDEDVEPE
jgi:hypothetical protein